MSRRGVHRRRARVARRLRRTLLTAIGIALAAAMLATAVVIADGLGQGFTRAVQAADLPDIIVRFDPQSPDRVRSRIRALPDIAAFATRQEFTNVDIAASGHESDRASAEVVQGARRGYAIVAGRDVSPHVLEVVVERGVAQSWGVRLGQTMLVDGLGRLRVVGFAEAPDDVGYPLGVPRFYLSESALTTRFGQRVDPRVTVAEIWLRDPSRLDEVLVQARTTSYGLTGVRIVTRSGVRVLLDQAAGIVIDLLVALSLFALLTAGVMLGASARADVQRRLPRIGITRAIGGSRAHVAGRHAGRAALVAIPATGVGMAGGILVSLGPSERLLTLLNEPPAGAGLILPLVATAVVSVAIPVLAAAWPAWRAAGRPPVALLRGAGITSGRTRSRRPGRRRGGLVALGARLVAARPGRLTATVVTLAVSTAFVALLLALAVALRALETDPGALGKRYQLTASLPASGVREIRRIPGVVAAAPRYEVQALDSFSLGETIDVVAYPGDHIVFEAPPLTSGRRLDGPGEAEVGAGLADALGLSPGSPLALALPSGAELRLRVAGIVSSLTHDGRVAYIAARALLRADPGAAQQIAVRLDPNANAARVSAALTSLGAAPAVARGATARGAPLVATLRTILRAVAVVDGLVCLYALVQSCALTLTERRRTVAVLRATGGGAGAIARLLAGVVATIVLPAGVLGILLERLVVGPSVARLAAGYATLALGAGPAVVGAVLGELVLAGVVAVAVVTRLATREPVVAGLAGS